MRTFEERMQDLDDELAKAEKKLKRDYKNLLSAYHRRERTQQRIRRIIQRKLELQARATRLNHT